MLQKIKDACVRFAFPVNSKHITVALSGGADSMALLYGLLALKDELGISKISAVHFNHQIRGTEALRDQQFVAEQCKKLDVELTIGSADVPKFANEQGIGIELAARKLRYEFFETLNTDYIATAHTASDNVETVIFNITRGATLSGLCGIPPVRNKYIRPLILSTRADVENYCFQSGIDFVTDSTNLCDDYTRNKIRHNVVPILRQINESVESATSRMCISLREDDDFINGIVSEKYNDFYKDGKMMLDDFGSLHPAIAKRLILKFVSSFNIELNNFHINAIYEICLSGGKTSLPQDKCAVADNGILNVYDNHCEQPDVSFSVDIQIQDNDLFENNKIVHNLLLKSVLDCDKIVGQLVLRTRQSGDTICLKNKKCTKTLKKLFCEYKIPLAERENLPVLADDLGVVWIYKIGVADRCAVSKNSKKVYKINVEQI